MEELPERLRGEVAAQGELLRMHGVTPRAAAPQAPEHGLDRVAQGADLDKNSASQMMDARYERSQVGESIQVSAPQEPPPVEGGSRLDKALEQARGTGHDAPSPDNPSMDR